jgi:hypothetical protein
VARGFESKQVEAQQEEAQRGRKPARAELSDAQKDAQARRQTLQLARARAAADLDRATAAPHRRMLEQALAALDAQLAELGNG